MSAFPNKQNVNDDTVSPVNDDTPAQMEHQTTAQWLHNHNQSGLKIMIINCRSIRSQSKRINLATLLSDHQIDIILGCESHLDHSFIFGNITIWLYYIQERQDPWQGRSVYWDQKLSAMADSSLSTDTELIWIKLLALNNRSVYICSYYRPPNNDLNSTIQLRYFFTLTLYVYVHVWICVYVSTCIVYVCTCIWMHVFTWVYAHVLHIYVHLHSVYLHTYALNPLKASNYIML